MKTVTAREANQGFSEMLSRVEQGEEVVITRYGKPVAVLRPFEGPDLASERQAKVERAMALTRKGLPWPEDALTPPTRDEMHER